MIEPSGRIQTFAWPGFHMIERSDRIKTFVWPGFHMIATVTQLQRSLAIVSNHKETAFICSAQNDNGMQNNDIYDN